MGKVSAGKVVVGSKIDKSEVEDELHNLQHCNVLFPPNPDASRGLEVIPVHDDVDEEIEGDRDP